MKQNRLNKTSFRERLVCERGLCGAPGYRVRARSGVCSSLSWYRSVSWKIQQVMEAGCHRDLAGKPVRSCVANTLVLCTHNV